MSSRIYSTKWVATVTPRVWGIDAQSNNEQSAEYYYMSRTTYNGQFTGRHQLTDDRRLDWSVGYAYANNCMPDRRRYVIKRRT